MRKLAMSIVAAATIAATGLSGLAAPASADGNSDDCTLNWVTVEKLEEGRYFGDARLQCPVLATVGGRWTLDGQALRGYSEKLGPGEVPVFDDLDLVTQPGRQLCFIAIAWGNDKGSACLTT